LAFRPKEGGNLPTVNLKSQLNILLQLQAIDSQIYGLNEQKTSLPKEVEILKTAFEEKKKRLADLEKVSLEQQKAKKDAEMELAAKEEGVKKLQGQLYSLKTNKEYNTMLQQIQDSKADSSRVEDKILEVMDKVENLRKEIEAEKGRLSQEEKVFNEAKKKVEDQLKEIAEKLAQLDAMRARVIPEIDKHIFSQYERILANREALAIVEVKNNICMGCNMLVPAQVINLIKMYERIVTCEVCNRMLFINEEQA
jgi:predicted  nucleic acid-binding Zn-ribbon protein